METNSLKQNKYKLPKLAKRSMTQQSKSVLHNTKRKYLLQNLSVIDRGINQHQTSRQYLLQKPIITVLKDVKNLFHYEQQLNSDKFDQHTISIDKINKKYQKSKRLQRKVIQNPFSISYPLGSKQTHQQRNEIYSYFNQTLERKLIIKQIDLKYKPPHRYKTQMVGYGSNLILFAGLGCEKKLTWAKLSLNPQSLELPEEQNLQDLKGTLPFYGHTMKTFKHCAYIFGGINGEILNDLTILNLKTMKIKSGPFAPFRRKEHAATFIGKFMIIYGGIDANQTKNNIFSYDAELSKWSTFTNTNLPALSYHSMITIPSKPKKKNANISEQSDWIYVFGGKNDIGQSSNKLYRFKIMNEVEIFFEEICINIELSDPIPDARYSCCFQYLENGNILLYGGKQTEQSFDLNVRGGTFCDTYIFNIFTKGWKRQESNMKYCQGMASVNFSGKVFIFGGCSDRNLYTNATMVVMKISENGVIATTKYFDEDGTNIHIATSKKILYQ